MILRMRAWKVIGLKAGTVKQVLAEWDRFQTNFAHDIFNRVIVVSLILRYEGAFCKISVVGAGVAEGAWLRKIHGFYYHGHRRWIRSFIK